MFETLYARLSAALILIFLLIGVAYVFISSQTTERYLQEITQHFNRDLAKRIVYDRQLITAGQLNKEALKSTFMDYMDINPSIEIYLLDDAGKILAYSADPGVVKRQMVDLEPIRAFLNGKEFPLLGDDPRSHDRRKAFSVTPVPSEQGGGGYLYVVLRGELYDRAEQAIEATYALRLSAWTLAGSLGFGLFAGLLLFNLLTRRLVRLSGVMEQFQQSGFTTHEPYLGQHRDKKDEIDQLGTTFDEMAARIISQWGELKRQDQQRRDLFAQLSHDLRTPLAALQGYIETLRLKSNELDQQQREAYLDIALRQSNHLQNMMEDLFDLSRLEAGDTKVQIEKIALAELVQDVVIKFQLKAEKKGVELTMRPPECLPMVPADAGMTERVLDNLINNALDHVNAGGEIRVVIDQSDTVGTVSICDDGPGIPEADLPRLFEPFYRGGKKEDDRFHAGLGLAIAQRCMNLQSGSISARNKPDRGCCFSVSLPLEANN